MSKNFAIELIRARKNKNISLRQLANRTQISPSRMSEIEHGAKASSQEQSDIVRVLKCKR